MKDFLQNVFRFLLCFPADVLYRVFYRSRCIGFENIPKSGGVIIASNHVSNMETILIPYMCIERFSSRRFWSPGKVELFRFAPLRRLLFMCRSFPIKRKRDYAAMNKISKLASSDVVMLFPEGTRSKDGRLQKGRPGVGKIIYDSKAAVIPTAVFNTQYCMPAHAWSPNILLPLAVVFGKPLDLRRCFGMPAGREAYEAIVNELMNAIADIQKEYAHLDSPPKRLLKGNSK
ncbi:MAG: 1-acyl-sn-glycerol-3-phosphate acyltransferase [bacterium]|nr:MAG: 1-acyl-sn-glycerol-3-phosphate acyltransferase [bacterium]